MIWATVSFRSCFYWLYTVSPSSATKNETDLISVLTIWWCPCVKPSIVLLKKGIGCDHAFSWQNSASCLVSFCSPRPDLPVTPSIFWLPTFEFQSPMMNRTFFLLLLLVIRVLLCLHRTDQLQYLQHRWYGDRLELLWCWMACLGNDPRTAVIFEVALKYWISDSFVDYEGYSLQS